MSTDDATVEEIKFAFWKHAGDMDAMARAALAVVREREGWRTAADDLETCPDCMGSGESGLGFSQACQTCDGAGGIPLPPPPEDG